MGNENIGEDMVEQICQNSKIESFVSISREGPTREILAKTLDYHDSSLSSHVLYTWLLRGLASRELLAKSTCTLF